MEVAQPFFSKLRASIDRFANSIRMTDPSQTNDPKYIVRQYLSEIAEHPDEYDKWCRISIKDIGDTFEYLVAHEQNSESCDQVLDFCGRFAYEKCLRTRNILPADRAIISWFRSPNTPPKHAEVAEFVWPTISLDLHREQIELTEAKSLEESSRTFQQKAKSNLDEMKAALDGYSSHAEKLKSHFNFVGLSHAFSRQASRASRQKFFALFFVSIFGFLACLALLLPLWFSQTYFLAILQGTATEDVVNTAFNRAIYVLAAIVPVVGLLVYFFRLSYASFKSAGAIQLQFEHRHAVCAFIEAYAKNKKDMGLDVEKFETMVFSGITPDPGNIPATFDGAESLIKLLNAFRGNQVPN